MSQIIREITHTFSGGQVSAMLTIAGDTVTEEGFGHNLDHVMLDLGMDFLTMPCMLLCIADRHDGTDELMTQHAITAVSTASLAGITYAGEVSFAPSEMLPSDTANLINEVALTPFVADILEAASSFAGEAVSDSAQEKLREALGDFSPLDSMATIIGGDLRMRDLIGTAPIVGMFGGGLGSLEDFGAGYPDHNVGVSAHGIAHT